MSRKLTYRQKEFLLENFFSVASKEFPGWQSTALALLDKGQAIVAGNECIWQGGIGNFIETKRAEFFIDCLEYKFDLESFLKSGFFKKTKKTAVYKLTKKIKKFELEINELNKL